MGGGALGPTLALFLAAAPPSHHSSLLTALMDLTVRSATPLLVCVDSLEMLHLLHEDEPFWGHSGEDQISYINVLQKFCTRESSGNPVIYNCSNPGLRRRKFLFLLPISLHTVPTVQASGNSYARVGGASSEYGSF